nr:hypothetical protein [Tanacetum cinerariifolium]
RENRKWLNKAIDEGPYEFRIFTPSETEAPRMQKEEDLRGDDLKHYEAEIEAMNLILISIPNDIYNSVNACKTTKSMWQRVEPLMRGTVQNKVDRETRFNNEFNQFVAEPGEALVSVYNREAVQNNFEDPLTSAMILLARAITQRFFNPTNNRLRTSSNTGNQVIVQGDKVNIQSKNYGNDVKNIRCLYVQEEIIEANVQCYNCSEKGHYARNCPKPRVQDSKYFMEHMLLAKHDKEGVILIDEHNDFLFADALRIKEIEELIAKCLMAKIQPTNFDSDKGLNYDYAFLSEVQTPSTSYVNPLFAKDAQEQKYSKQSKIIYNTIGDDQIDSNIIFDAQNGDVNSGSIEYDNNVQELYALEELARNTYKEAVKQQIIAKKVQQQNTVLTLQLEFYKKKV